MPYYIGDVIQDEKKLIARTPEKFRESGIDAQIHARVEGIDPAKGEVALRDGRIFPYDVLVMATGTSAFVPDLPGLDLPGVVSLRNLEDAIAIKEEQIAALKEYKTSLINAAVTGKIKVA